MKITIVTITYNAENTLQPTIESVLAQTYPNVEHLIVDGASHDGTLAIAENYHKQSDAANNGHVVVIQSEPDKGLYDAMNKGLHLATGDYVLFLNAGDRFPDNNTLQFVAGQAVRNDKLPAVLYGDTNVVDKEGHFLHRRRLSPPETLTWRSFRYGMLVCHQAFYARLDIAQSVEYDLRYRYSADVDWCIRIMKKAEKQELSLMNVHQVVVEYLNEGQTTQHHRASLRERFSIMRKHYGLLTTLAMHAYFVLRTFIKKN